MKRRPSFWTAAALALALPAAALPPADPAADTLASDSADSDTEKRQASPELFDPSARLPGGGAASEYWDLTADLDSGHTVVARFLVTNAGPGERNGVAIGYAIGPDGSAQRFQNGRRESRWQLSDDRLHLDIGASELDLHGPEYRLDVHKRDIAIDLRFAPAGQTRVPPSVTPEGLTIEVLAASTAAHGTLHLKGVSKPLHVKGRLALVHTWSTRDEADLVERRIEFFSLQDEEIQYLLDLTPKEGKRTHWYYGEDVKEGWRVETSEVDVAFEGTLPWRNGDRYWLPAGMVAKGPEVEARVPLSDAILEDDPLEALPGPIRFFLSLRMRPRRVWAESPFEVTLRPRRQRTPLHLDGSGLTSVTFLNPVAQKSR